jgi:sugar lactone lactonase YvrE
VYSVATNTIRRVLDSHYSQQPNTSVWLNINGQPVDLHAPMMTGSDGIALTPDAAHLYFCPLTSREIYRLPTALLRQFDTPESTLARSVQHVLSRRTASDGLAFASDGKLYLTGLEIDGMEVAPSPMHSAELHTLVSERRTMMWPDTIGWVVGWLGGCGYMVVSGVRE